MSPAGTGTVDITVTTPAGTSTTSSADQFTYGTVVTGVSPSSGPDTGGTTVDILGSGFSGATVVDFGATAATSFTINSSVSITATSPPGTGTVNVSVTSPSGTSPTSVNDRFTYTPGPVVGLGLVITTGSGTPLAACAPASSSCRAPNSTTCMMTGTNSSTTCGISGIWKGKHSTNVVFYLETVDAAGNPVAVQHNDRAVPQSDGGVSDIDPDTGDRVDDEPQHRDRNAHLSDWHHQRRHHGWGLHT